MGIHPLSFGYHFGWDPVFISHQHVALVLSALKSQARLWRTSLLLQITRQAGHRLGGWGRSWRRGVSTRSRWELSLGLPQQRGERSSLGLADRPGLAAHRAAAPRGATATRSTAAAAATSAAPVARSAAGGPATPAARATAAAGTTARPRAAAAGGLTAAHFTAVLLLRTAGEAIPWAAPHGPRRSGRRSGTRLAFPKSEGHLPRQQLLYPLTGGCWHEIHSGKDLSSCPNRGQLSLAQVAERRGDQPQTLALEWVPPFHIFPSGKLAVDPFAMDARPGKPELKAGCPVPCAAGRGCLRRSGHVAPPR